MLTSSIQMLAGLFGNKNIERILFFLLLHKKCYASKLHEHLKVPLTPLQKAFLRLEKAGIVTSFYEGKMRVYEFSCACPFLSELTVLLEKSYQLLSEEEKGLFLVAEHRSKENQHVLSFFWQKLHEVQKVTLKGKFFHTKMETHQIGQGKVSREQDPSGALIFREEGLWEGKGKVSFRNIFRWTLDSTSNTIGLEHLRRGINNPVLLFQLSPTSNQTLGALHSYQCEEDTYFGYAFLEKGAIKLFCRVFGRKKNEEILYVYS